MIAVTSLLLDTESIMRVSELIHEHSQASSRIKFAMELEQRLKLSLLRFDYREVAVLALALDRILK